MARVANALFLSTMCALFSAGMPFLRVQQLLRSSPSGAFMLGTRSSSSSISCNSRHIRTRASAVKMEQKENDEDTELDSSVKDVCKGPDGKTPMWHRIAHKNSVRVNVGDELPGVPVRPIYVKPASQSEHPHHVRFAQEVMTMLLRPAFPLENGPRRLEADGSVTSLTLKDLFADKKGVLVGVPGAFTPTCSQVHLPEFVERVSRLAAVGAEVVAFISVNDVYVMRAWENVQQTKGKVTMISDGNGELSASLGMMVDLSADGMGLRCRRFLLVAEEGKVTHVAVSEGPGMGGVTAVAAERALAATRPETQEELQELHAELERELETRATAAAVAAEAAGIKQGKTPKKKKTQALSVPETQEDDEPRQAKEGWSPLSFFQ